MLSILLVAQMAAGAPIRLDPDTGWVTNGETRVVNQLGRRAIQVRNGVAYRPDVVFADGTIEFDFAPLIDRRSFLGFGFRMTTPDDYEDIYFRPHASGAWDALQYDGVWKGAGSWQLYWGPGATAPVDFTPSRWTRVRIVVRGPRAEVYYDGSDSAALVVPELKRGGQSGFAGIWGFYPNARGDTSFVGGFSNIVLYPGTFRTGTAPDPVVAPPPAGTIMRWRVSPPRATTDSLFPATPPPAMEARTWRILTAEANGLINVSRLVGTPDGAQRAIVFARTTVTSRSAQLARLDVGYSDDIAVYLNGRLVYRGINGFGSRYPLFLGMVRPEFEAVHLPLAAGQNVITLAVQDDLRFGWGFIGRLTARAPLRVAP